MRNKKFIIFLVLTLMFSFFSAIGISEAIKTYTPVVRYDEPINVIVADRDTPAYTKVEHAEYREMPQSLVPDGALTKLEQVEGKVLKTSLLAGDIIRNGHISDLELSAKNDLVISLSGLDNPDLRGYPLSIPKGFDVLSKWDRINIIHVGSRGDQITATTIFENIDIVFVNEQDRIMFLSLTQKEAEKLSQHIHSGNIILTVSPVHALK